MSTRTIWINAGEASGDMHGAALIRALRTKDPSLEFMGMGGSAMRSEGFDIRHDMSLISIVGLSAIVSALPKIVLLLHKIKSELRRTKPAAVILIDCPEFNFRVAKIAHSLGIPVFYYISPQVWAWRSGRVKFLQKYVRRVLCILPFEKGFYSERGVDVDFVGHPLLDELPLDKLDAISPDPMRVGILPGSRKKEVETLLPLFAQSARALHSENPVLTFSLFRAPGMDHKRLTARWPEDIPTVIVEPENRHTEMRSCAMAMAASGTVSLELALIGVPTLIAYRLPRWQEVIAAKLINVNFAGLPCLILNEEVFPELLGPCCTADNITAVCSHWLSTEGKLDECRARLAVLRRMLGKPGAPDRAADIILKNTKI